MDPRDLIEGIQIALLKLMLTLMALAVIITLAVVILRNLGFAV